MRMQEQMENRSRQHDHQFDQHEKSPSLDFFLSDMRVDMLAS